MAEKRVTVYRVTEVYELRLGSELSGYMALQESLRLVEEGALEADAPTVSLVAIHRHGDEAGRILER
mgnify:CR=1 FL=1